MESFVMDRVHTDLTLFLQKTTFRFTRHWSSMPTVLLPLEQTRDGYLYIITFILKFWSRDSPKP